MGMYGSICFIEIIAEFEHVTRNKSLSPASIWGRSGRPSEPPPEVRPRIPNYVWSPRSLSSATAAANAGVTDRVSSVMVGGEQKRPKIVT